jgi:putative ABC transport system permease protein
MWRMVLRDLQWRRRRFVLAGLATALVFAMTLLLTGLTTAVHNEGIRTVERFHADRWLVGDADSGPFTSAPRVPLTLVDEIAATPGVERADPVLFLLDTVDGDPLRDINITALRPDSPSWPAVVSGTSRVGPGQAVVDTGLGFDVGDAISIDGHRLTVVGEARHVSRAFGIPTVFTPLDETRDFALGGAALVSAVAVHGHPSIDPAGTVALDDTAMSDDLARPLARGTDSIRFILILLTVTAAGIVGLIVYLSTLERTGDLAVLRATGSSKAFVAVSLAIQGLILSLVSAIGSVVIAQLLTPVFPLALEVEAASYVQLLVLALVVGALASVAGVWRAVRTDPALAFGAA